jgi:hypothetical protein
MKSCIALLLVSLVFSGCAPSTPQARIEKYPEKFAALSKKEQALVLQGQIDRDMSMDAVMLAWGAPDRSFEGSKNAKLAERWDYFGTVPVYSPPAYVYGAYRYGGYGRYRGYPGYGFALGPEVDYVPYRAASVWFTDRRVDSWERLR